MLLATVLFVAVLSGLVPAVIARQRGYSFFLWWLVGAALFPIALPILLRRPMTEAALRRVAADRVYDRAFRECPKCHEDIRRQLDACPSCGRKVEPTHHAFSTAKALRNGARPIAR